MTTNDVVVAPGDSIVLFEHPETRTSTYWIVVDVTPHGTARLSHESREMRVRFLDATRANVEDADGGGRVVSWAVLLPLDDRQELLDLNVSLMTLSIRDAVNDVTSVEELEDIVQKKAACMRRCAERHPAVRAGSHRVDDLVMMYARQDEATVLRVIMPHVRSELTSFVESR